MKSKENLIDILQTLVQLKNINQEISDRILFLADQMVKERLNEDSNPNCELGWDSTVSSEFIPFTDPSEIYMYAFD